MARDLPALATAPDLAEFLGVSDRTVRSWRTKGLEPAGTYLPPGSKTPVDLYSLDEAQSFRNRR